MLIVHVMHTTGLRMPQQLLVHTVGKWFDAQAWDPMCYHATCTTKCIAPASSHILPSLPLMYAGLKGVAKWSGSVRETAIAQFSADMRCIAYLQR